MGVRVSLSPSTMPVEALTVATCDVSVSNGGEAATEYRLEVLGLASGWAWISPVSVTVPPGGEAGARVSFRLPRSPEPSAGPLPIRVRATSVSDAGDAAVAEATLDVAPFTNLYVTIEPRTSRSKGAAAEHRVAVENRGNAPARARLSALDPEEALEIELEPAELVAGAGAAASATVRVRPRSRLLRGGERLRPFHVVAEPDGGPPMRVDATLAQVPVGRTGPALAGLVVLALLGVVAWKVASSGGGSDADPAPAVATGTAGACPARDHLNRDRRTTGQLPVSYSFLYASPDGCQPMRFNPCEPVHYVVNDAVAPPGGVDDLREAFNRISALSGLQFVSDGRTDERFSAGRDPYQPDSYGNRWAPILVTWSSLGNQGRNDIIIAGTGNPVPVDGVLVTGVLQLNVDARTDLARTKPLPDGFGEGITWGRVMLHELGHVFGLGHVSSRANIMHEELTEHTQRFASYGDGDATAFRLVGRDAGCVQTPTPRPVRPTFVPPTTAAR